MRALPVNRRNFLTAAMALPAAALPLEARSPRTGVAQEPQDRMEGAPIGDGQKFEPVRGRLFTTPYDNDPFIIGVEEQVRCTCGCLHTVYVCRMVDFSCDFWPRHHATMVEQATAGWTAEEIIRAYVTQNGEEYLMMRPEGFNLLGYILPGALIAVGATLLARHLHRAHRVAEAGAAEIDVGLSDDDRRLLQDELEDLEV
jgi:hypothetical protein